MNDVTMTRSEDGEFLILRIGRTRRFQDILVKIKSLPGARYDGETKAWSVPAEASTAERAIVMLDPQVSDEIKEWAMDARAQDERDLTTPIPEDAELVVPWATERCDWQPSHMGDEPFKGLKRHQRPVVDLIAKPPHRLVIADDMGLGKTGMAISGVAEYEARTGKAGDHAPRLVICPNSVKGVWARDIKSWLGPDEPVVVIDAATPKKREAQLTDAIAAGAWVIINPEQLRVERVRKDLPNGGRRTVEQLKQPLFETTAWRAVIADEGHRFKERKALQTKGLFRVTGDVQLLMTGTPIQNSPAELWSPLRWLFPDEYNEKGRRGKGRALTFWAWHESYCDTYEGWGGHRVVVGVKNPDALRFELKGKLVRRTKGEVLDLPPKSRVIIPLQLSGEQAKLYADAEKALWIELVADAEAGDDDAKQFLDLSGTREQLQADFEEALAAQAWADANAIEAKLRATPTLLTLPNGAARFVRLRQLLESPALIGGNDVSVKLDAVAERIVDADRPQTAFTQFRGTTRYLAQRLTAKGLEVAVIHGGIKPADRTRAAEAFQDGKLDVVVGTIEALGEGVTLTRADTTHFVSRHVKPTANDQAEDRHHRIGQHRPLTVNVYEVEDTIDTGKVRPLNERKRGIIGAIVPQDHVKESHGR